MKMTVRDVHDRLEAIEAVQWDDEVAHINQDNLFREVLTAIASGEVGLRGARNIAAAALTVDDIEFARWMA